MRRIPDRRPRGARAACFLAMLGLVLGPASPARGEAGLSEIARARAAWLKRPYALVHSGDRQIGPDHAHLVRARDARWGDFLALGGAIVPIEPVAGVGDEDIGPFAVVGPRFVFRFNGPAGYGVLDMDRPDAAVERLSRSDLIVTLGAIPDLADFDTYYASHWSWPTPGNVLGQLAFLALGLVLLVMILLVIPLSIAWLILHALRRVAPRLFIPLPSIFRRAPAEPGVDGEIVR